MLFVESEYVVDRLNRSEASRAMLMQLAIASGMGSKKAKEEFDRQIKKLMGL